MAIEIQNVGFKGTILIVIFAISGLGLQEFVDSCLQASGIGHQHALFGLKDKLSTFLMDSRSINTTKKYFGTFNRWKQFSSFYNLPCLPAQSIHIALYLTHLIDKKSTSSVIDSVIYSLKWVHSLFGLQDPTDNSFVKNLQSSARRLNNNPIRKKDPVSSEMLVQLCDKYKDSNDLMVVRDLTMILLGFAGFFRFDEISNLKCKDVKIFDDYLCILVQRSKTDQFRHGDEILISKGNTNACPCKMYKHYLFLSGLNPLSDVFIFRPIFRSSGIAKLIFKNKKISYTSARENIVRRLREVAPELNLGLHSLRSGGATAAALSNVGERCIKRHGRWKSDLSKDGYIDDSFQNRISVSKSLML